MRHDQVGYARVSSIDQNPARQEHAIREAIGGEPKRWFVDKASGRTTDRPALRDALDWLRDGDTLVVASFDRLARSVVDLRRIVDDLVARGVRVHFAKESMTFAADATDPMATLLLSVMGAIAEFEVALIRERQAEGIAIAKAKGKYRGRKPVATASLAGEARALIDAGVPKAEAARRLGVSRSSIYQALTAPRDAR
nr:recombinase family protein [Xylanimonas protaetiae]